MRQALDALSRRGWRWRQLSDREKWDVSWAFGYLWAACRQPAIRILDGRRRILRLDWRLGHRQDACATRRKWHRHPACVPEPGERRLDAGPRMSKMRIADEEGIGSTRHFVFFVLFVVKQLVFHRCCWRIRR